MLVLATGKGKRGKILSKGRPEDLRGGGQNWRNAILTLETARFDRWGLGEKEKKNHHERVPTKREAIAKRGDVGQERNASAACLQALL